VTRARGRKRPSGRAHFGRIAVLVSASVLALALLGAAAASFTLHRVLTTGKLREWVNGNPEKLRLEYASASGWFPWNVHVRGLELRSRDSNVEWWFRMDDVRLSFDPLALLGKRFHATRVRGDGLVFRLRVREGPEASAAHTAALPAIPGFEKTPRRDEPPPPLTSGGRAAAGPSRPFHVRIDDLKVANVHEVWIDIWRLGGSHAGGTLSGSFDLYPGHSARIGPARVELSQADVQLGPARVAGPVSFATEAVIRRFDSQVVHGNAVWPYITGQAHLDGTLDGLSFLNYFLGDPPEPKLSGGAGHVHLALTVDAGKGVGELRTESRRVDAVYRGKGTHILADVTTQLRIRQWDVEHDRLDIGGTVIDLRNATVTEPGPDSRAWWGRFDLPAADVRGDRTPGFVAKVLVHARDARPLFTLFQVGLPGWARGVLRLEGVEARGTVGLGKDVVDVEDLDAAGGAFRIRGWYRERGASTNGAFLLESKLLSLGLDIEPTSSKLKLVGATRWFADHRSDPAKKEKKN
jgi:hypothetical protein